MLQIVKLGLVFLYDLLFHIHFFCDAADFDSCPEIEGVSISKADILQIRDISRM